jgi:hypothetical protein
MNIGYSKKKKKGSSLPEVREVSTEVAESTA